MCRAAVYLTLYHFAFTQKSGLDIPKLYGPRDGLIDKMEPSSVNRTRIGLRAALELAATLDHRITNRHVFRLGLRTTPQLVSSVLGHLVHGQTNFVLSAAAGLSWIKSVPPIQGIF